MSSAAPISLQDSDTDSDVSDRGYFVNSDEVGMVHAGTEAEEGFGYPICIGDVLEHTYRIEHKFGHDNFSTVWLARDIKKNMDVALKIMTPGRDAGDYEFSMQKKIKTAVQDTSNLVTYLTAFPLSSRKGNHQGLVFPMTQASSLLC
jgi:serine/threonine protein kinase